MDMGVDEAGDDVAPGDVEDARGLRSFEPAHLGDHRVDQGHVGAKRRPARAVDHPAALQDQVECHADRPGFWSTLPRTADSAGGVTGRAIGCVGSLPDDTNWRSCGKAARSRPGRGSRAGLGSSASPWRSRRADAHAQVARGQDVGPIESEDQEHLGGPDADPLDGGECLR